MVHGTPFFVSVLSPVILVLLLNYAIIIIIIKKIHNKTKKRHQDKSHFQRLVKDARNAFVVNSLLGITWVFALFAVSGVTMLFQWLFCIVNSLQGFFIFIFYIVSDQEVWNNWKKLYKTEKASESAGTFEMSPKRIPGMCLHVEKNRYSSLFRAVNLGGKKRE